MKASNSSEFRAPAHTDTVTPRMKQLLQFLTNSQPLNSLQIRIVGTSIAHLAANGDVRTRYGQFDLEIDSSINFDGQFSFLLLTQ